MPDLLLEFFSELLVFIPECGGGLLQVTQAINEFCDVAVHDIGIVLRINV